MTSHRQTQRPWGHYEVIHRSGCHQIKQIFVKPGGQLSLQRHAHRSEHWVVVSGVARVTKGDQTMDLMQDQSVHVSAGCWHRLENPAQFPLIVIEVQVGSYLGEDDIERLEDVYGRK